MSANRADEENLKTTSFTKGEWTENDPIALAMDYDLVAETFATAGVPLATITPLTLTALAYVTGGLDSALMKRPDDLLTEWESAITARGAQAGGGGRGDERACDGGRVVHVRCRAHGRTPRRGKRWRDAIGESAEGVAAGADGWAERTAFQAACSARRRARLDTDGEHPIAGDAAWRKRAGRQRLF